MNKNQNINTLGQLKKTNLYYIYIFLISILIGLSLSIIYLLYYIFRRF